MNDKITRFLSERRPETPCLVVDLDVVRRNYEALGRLLPAAEIFYSVKANPAPEVLELLARLGSGFDAASRFEIDACLAAGTPPERISYGNTVKKQIDVAHAHGRGIGLFAFDSAAELDKIAAAAPRARVFCRIQTAGDGAHWPLAEKFGCEVEMARDLLVRAREVGLDPHGVSFHVGSQQTEPAQWELAIERTASLFSALGEAGIGLRMVNLGGGFPVPYLTEVPSLSDIVGAVAQAMTRSFGNPLPRTILEPGRWLAATAGVIESEVVLISRKSYDSRERWVYLDIGKFGGLFETTGEAIRYRIRTPRDGGPTGPAIVAGPTCDGADVLYANYELPLDLEVGDKVEILCAGAYTSAYASAGFNGFPPLKQYYI